MGILNRARAVWRREGAQGLGKRVTARLRAGGGAYQEKLDQSFLERWGMIQAQIPPDAGSLLDVGSNLGAFTAAAAREGLWSVGIEKMPDLAQRAQRLHAGQPDCAFMCAELDIETCRKLPAFDVILLLSVHHHWHNAFGKEEADEMLELMIRKSSLLIFEGPARTSRYTRETPDFVANDEASVTAYYREFLTAVAGARGRIVPLGKTDCVGEREPYRWMYAISR